MKSKSVQKGTPVRNTKSNNVHTQTDIKPPRTNKERYGGDKLLKNINGTKLAAKQTDDIFDSLTSQANQFESIMIKNIDSIKLLTSAEKKLFTIKARSNKDSIADYQKILKTTSKEINDLLNKKKAEADLISLLKERRKELSNSTAEALQQLEISKKLKTTERENIMRRLEDGEKELELIDQKNAAYEKIKEKHGELIDHATYIEARDAIKSFVDLSSTIMGNFKVATGILGGSIVAKMTEVVTSANKIKKEMGLTASDTISVAGSMLKAQGASLLMGIHTQTIAEATHSILEVNKSIDSLNTKAIKQVATMIDKYGLYSDEAANLYDSVMDANIQNQEMAGHMLDYGKNLANAAHIPIGVVMKDVATNTELFAGASKDGGKHLFDAATTAARLQVTLADMSQISTGLLDIDKSLASEQKIAAMFGANINFEKARQMAWNDDIDGAGKEILRQLSEELDWNNMNAYQRNVIAKEMGSTVEVMNEMMVNQADMLKQKQEENTLWGKTYNIVKGVYVTGKEWGVQIAALVNWSGSLLRNWKQIGPTVGAAVSTMGGWFKKIPGVGKISEGFGKIGGKIKGAFSGKGIDDATEGTKKITSKPGPKGINPVAKFFKDFNKVETKDILKGGLAMVTISVSLAAVAGAMMLYTFVPFDAFMKGLVALGALTGSIVLIGKATGSIIKGAAAMVIIGAAMIPFGAGMMLMSGVDWSVIAAASVAMIALAGASVLLGMVAPLAYAGAGVMVVLGVAMLGFGAGISLMANGMATMAPILSTIVPLIGQLALLSMGMFAIGAGFGAMGLGLLPLAAGLALVSPFVGVMAALSTMSGSSSSTSNSGGSTQESSGGMAKIEEQLGTLISLVEKGGNVYLDNRQIGKWLGAHQATVSAIENRR